MHRLREAAGFTLIELVIVLAIIGVVSAFAVPSFSRYQNQEEAKEIASRVAAGLRRARTLSMQQGISHFVLFNPAPNVLLRIVRDVDGDYMKDAAELSQDVTVRQFSESTVTAYNAAGQTPPHGAGKRVPGDLQGGTLAAVDNGASFPVDGTGSIAHTTPTGLAAVGFTTRGIPVPIDKPNNLGSGAGAFYVTDNRNAVYAAVVGGLGEIRVRTYVPGVDQWR